MAGASALALAIEARMRACPGIAGLDPDSRLTTVGPGHLVRGVRLSPGADGGAATLRLDVVGLAGARLPEAAQAARAAALGLCADQGVAVEAVEVHVTEVADEVLPPQEGLLAPPPSQPRGPATAAPEPAPAGPGPPPPEPDPGAAAVDPERVREPPWPAPPGAAAPPAPAGAQTVRVSVRTPDGTEIPLLITVRVDVENP